MAAYVRGMVCLFSSERHMLLSRGCGVVLESKRYVRGLRRRAVRVLESQPEVVKTTKIQPEEQKLVKKKKEEEVKKEEKVKFSSIQREGRDYLKTSRASGPSVKDDNGGLFFETAHPGDKRLAKLASVARSRTYREKQGKILLEGRRLICDALDAGANPQIVFFSMVERLKELPLDKMKRATLVKVKFEEIKIWSDLVAPQGVMAIFALPDLSRMNFVNRGQSLPLSLICDNIRDPGNLGTMLRCAAAAGCSNVLLTKGCVDPWEPKVLRSAMGAHFRLPIYSSLDWKDIRNHLPDPVTVHVADSSYSPDVSAETDVNPSHKHLKASDYGWVSKRQGNRTLDYEDSDSDSSSDSDDVETKLYHENWAQSPSALVIGGETHGLSEEAVQMAEDTDGHRLFIPVTPGVDSLNSAMAASILLFEGRQQLLKLQKTLGNKWQTKPKRQFS